MPDDRRVGRVGTVVAILSLALCAATWGESVGLQRCLRVSVKHWSRKVKQFLYVLQATRYPAYVLLERHGLSKLLKHPRCSIIHTSAPHAFHQYHYRFEKRHVYHPFPPSIRAGPGLIGAEFEKYGLYWAELLALPPSARTSRGTLYLALWLTSSSLTNALPFSCEHM
jgi:hypothetical protein